MSQLQNERHELFAQFYAAGASAAAAYVRAGFKANRNARIAACRLRKEPKVQARILELQEQMVSPEDRLGANIDYDRDKLRIVTEIDPLDVYEEDPSDPYQCRMKRLSEIPPAVRQALKSRTDPSGRVHIEPIDKLQAMALLMKMTPGGYIERHEISGPGGSPLQVTIAHLVDRLYTEQVLERAGPKTLEILNRIEADLRLLASEETGEAVIDAEAVEVA
jgi:Terminase small subunit